MGQETLHEVVLPRKCCWNTNQSAVCAVSALKLQMGCKVPLAQRSNRCGRFVHHEARDVTELGFSALKNLFLEFISHKCQT